MADKQQPSGKESNNDKNKNKGLNKDTAMQQSSEEERLLELRETAEAVGKLAEDEKAFTDTVEAFRAKDAERFQSELSKIGLLARCRYICRFLCSKHCLFRCSKFCKVPQRKEDQLAISEIREFAQVVSGIAKDETLLRELADAFDKDNEEAFNALITRLKLESFCHQLCHWLCTVRCRLVCKEMCPQPPLITEVANIPTSQITTSGPGTGLAAGPSLPPGTTGGDLKSPGGIGDHPFGGVANIQGVFSIANPFQYKVEYATAPGGPWTPILASITDLKWVGFILAYSRVPDAQGWYNVSDMGLLGPDYLTDWQTPPDRNKTYYIKLTVRNTTLTEFESPVVPARVDNGAPTKPIIDLELQKPDGTRVSLGCCEKMEQGEGNLLVITLTASDENFGGIGVILKGGCGVSMDIIDTSGNHLSKTYNGNIADTGYPAPTTFIWDPWKAKVDPCCYLIEVSINDRAIVNNSGYNVHSNSNWHSITIA